MPSLPGPRFVVIAGTDTGVGKTFVGVGLARAWRAADLKVVAIKPIESGCSDRPTPEAHACQEDQEDGVCLARAAGQASPAAALVRLPEPLAPPLAAELAERVIDWEALLASTRAAAAGADVALVEGAGGLRTPLTWRHDLLDLAQALGAPVLLVAADALGTLSHTLLCLGALEAAGLQVAGVVLVTPAAPDRSTGENLHSLRRLRPKLALWGLPRIGWGASPTEALEAIARALVRPGEPPS